MYDEIINMIIIAIISTLASVLLRLLNIYINKAKEQIDNEKINLYIDKVGDIVKSSVLATEQTLVKSAKSSNSWSLDLQKKAFNECLNNVKTILGHQGLALLKDVCGDIDKYIGTLIESNVKELRG